MLYNSAKSCGFIYNILKYRKARAKPRSTEINTNIVTDAIDAIHSMTLNDDMTEEEKKEILLFFKSCLVRDERSVLLEKLKISIKLRCEVLKDGHMDSREVFPFYYTSPDIVRLEMNNICTFIKLQMNHCISTLHFYYRLRRISKFVGLSVMIEH